MFDFQFIASRAHFLTDLHIQFILTVIYLESPSRLYKQNLAFETFSCFQISFQDIASQDSVLCNKALLLLLEKSLAFSNFKFTTMASFGSIKKNGLTYPGTLTLLDIPIKET